MTTIGAIAPYFGCKRAMGPLIARELGAHQAYWEPFCGSMAVLLAKPRATIETVNDRYGAIVNLARVIQDPMLGPAIFCEALFCEAADRLRARGKTDVSPAPDLEWAFDFFCASWWGRNGVTGTQSYNQGFAARFTKSGGQGGQRFTSAVDSIPAWRRRLRRVTILNRCGFGLLEKIEDAPGVVIYCDPPYIEKGASYIHDFEAEDHRRLAELLGRFKRSRVVVSYYAHELLAELYPAPTWTVVDCSRTKAMVSASMRDQKGAAVAPDVLLINGPSLTRGGEGGLF